MSKYLLRVEGVNIENFMDDTADLNTIRGGGLILLDAVRDLEVAMGSTLTPISVGASSGLWEFEEEPDTVVKQVRSYLSEEPYRHATFVVDFVEATDNFQHDREIIIAKNRFQQLRSPSFAIPASVPSSAPCELNLVRPATGEGRFPENKTKMLSASVMQRREFGQENKRTLFYKKYAGSDVPRVANSFEGIALDKSRGILNRKIGVIYLDGNRFGKIQSEVCRTPDLLREFDRELQRHRKAMFGALLQRAAEMDRIAGWTNDNGELRFETLLWGGDEMMWVVPAWQAWDVLSFFFDHSADWGFQGRKLTHSAGLVFCHHSAPIRRVKKLVQDLAQNVKDLKPVTNSFAYEVLESFDHIGDDIEPYRLTRTPQHIDTAERLKGLILSGASMGAIVSDFRAIKDAIPRRRLYRIGEMLIHGDSQDLIKKEIFDLKDEFKESDRALLENLLGLLTSGASNNATAWVHLNSLWDYLI